MVYRGRLSPGCALCRTRRLKCDRKRPSCTQCLRIGRDCSGYRDLTALRFYDQSQEVIGKAKSRYTAAAAQGLASLSPEDQQVSPPLTPILVSVDDRATFYTFKYFIGQNTNLGVLPYIPQLLDSDPSPNLIASIKAIGLAVMSNRQMSPDLMQSAYSEYSTALLATNRALQDPAMCKSDSTLAAVMLLSMYEVITCHACGIDLMDRWANHIHGAMRLMELRGAKQLETPAGLELFSQIRIQIAISNIFYKRYSSPVIAQLSKLAKAYRDHKSQVMDNFYDIITRIGDLSAMISDSIPNTPSSNPALFIQRALHLDADLVAWAMSVDPTWHYTVVKASPVVVDDDGQIYHSIYGDTYHKYKTLGLASLWNVYRLSRIILRKIIESTCKSMLRQGEFPENRLTMAQSVVVIEQIAEDVCASVPYHFTSDEVAVGGLMRLIWPLFVASDCVDPESKMKRWILQTLDKIGYTTGIQQALMMSKLARAGNSYSVTQELYKEDKMRQSAGP